jgi:hypothetical protein
MKKAGWSVLLLVSLFSFAFGQETSYYMNVQGKNIYIFPKVLYREWLGKYESWAPTLKLKLMEELDRIDEIKLFVEQNIFPNDFSEWLFIIELPPSALRYHPKERVQGSNYLAEVAEKNEIAIVDIPWSGHADNKDFVTKMEPLYGIKKVLLYLNTRVVLSTSTLTILYNSWSELVSELFKDCDFPSLWDELGDEGYELSKNDPDYELLDIAYKQMADKNFLNEFVEILQNYPDAKNILVRCSRGEESLLKELNEL